ncbi:MAG: LysR family transcriptional regulator substrate-binding protein [Ruthenibacterium lactatiformans]
MNLFFWCPKNFCATKGAVPLSLFSGKRFLLLLSAGTGLLKTSLELCRKAGFSPQVGYTGAAAGNIARMVRSGAGVAMFPGVWPKPAQVRTCAC